MKLFKAAAFALSVMAVVGISVTISSADQEPVFTPTPTTGTVTPIPTQFDTDYMYMVTDADAKECEIIYYRGSSSSELIVPSKLGEYTVKTIGSGAYRSKNITSVQIPLSVDSIDYYAFGTCQNLKSVMILNKNIRIHEDAFKGSNKIDTIIYSGTYAEAEALLDKVNLPEGVKVNLISYPSPTMSITQAPEPTEAVISEVPEPSVTTIPLPTKSTPDYLYEITDKDAKECEIVYYEGSSKDLIVPSKLGDYTVKSIGSGAYALKNFTSVQIPLSVEEIKYRAFGFCENLTSVMLLNKNVKIDPDAFSGCENINTIIYSGTYAEAEALLKTVNLPEGIKINLISYPSPTMSITQAPEPTEAEVTQAPKPTIAEATETPVPTVIVSATPAPSATETPVPTVIVSATPAPSATETPVPTVIVSATPAPSAAVTATVTPTAAPSVTVTATPAPSVTVTATPTPTVTVAAKPAFTAKVGGNTYKIKGKEITVTAVSAKASKVVIPSTVKINGKKYKVTSVSAAAFKKNKSLTSVTIGKNITSIAKNAFKGKADLAKITVKSTVLKKIGKGAFSGIAKKVTIVIPKKKAKAYKKLFDKAVKAKITYKTV